MPRMCLQTQYRQLYTIVYSHSKNVDIKRQMQNKFSEFNIIKYRGVLSQKHRKKYYFLVLLFPILHCKR